MVTLFFEAPLQREKLPCNYIMELPEELLLAICEHLQPPRYEDDAAHPADRGGHYARRCDAHRPAATVKLVSRGFRGLMTRTTRVVRAMDYRSLRSFAAQTHRNAEFFYATCERSTTWVDDAVLRSLHKVMPRLRAVGLYGGGYTSKGVEALVASTRIEAYHQHDTYFTSAFCRAVAAAPLTTLTLSLFSRADSLSPLDNHPTLKYLSLKFYMDQVPLPESLPNLETMTIAVGPRTHFNWSSVLPFCPSLKKLIIDDQCGDELRFPSTFGSLTPRTLNNLMADLPALQTCHVIHVSKFVLHACSTFHNGERIICYRAPPGVSLTFGPEAFPRGVRVVLDVDTAPLPLAVAVWDLQTITDLDATAVPLGYV